MWWRKIKLKSGSQMACVIFWCKPKAGMTDSLSGIGGKCRETLSRQNNTCDHPPCSDRVRWELWLPSEAWGWWKVQRYGLIPEWHQSSWAAKGPYNLICPLWTSHPSLVHLCSDFQSLQRHGNKSKAIYQNHNDDCQKKAWCHSKFQRCPLSLLHSTNCLYPPQRLWCVIINFTVQRMRGLRTLNSKWDSSIKSIPLPLSGLKEPCRRGSWKGYKSQRG